MARSEPGKKDWGPTEKSGLCPETTEAIKALQKQERMK